MKAFKYKTYWVFLYVFLSFGLTSALAEETEKGTQLRTSSNASIGYGMPYGGGLGGSVAIELRDNVCASGGFGISQDMVVGIKFYFREIEQIIRPTASYHSWLSNAPIQTAGGAIFAGLEIRPSFSKEFMFTTEVGYGSFKRGEKISFSIGLGFNVNLQLINLGP